MTPRWVTRIACILVGLVSGISSVSASDGDALIKLLIKKGLITEQELAQVEAELATEQAQVPTPTARAPKTVEERLAKLEKDIGDKSVIRVGQGTLKVGGLFQGWALWDGNDNDRFRIRRTELKFAGDILGDERFTYTIMIDPSQVLEDGSRDSPLQDAFFTIDQIPFLPHHKIDLGQYKLPMTEEGLRSSAKLDTAERSFIGRTFGDQRDIGAMLTGEWPYVTYQLGIFNGSGQNQSDPNDQKDLAGRVVLRPLKALELTRTDWDLGAFEVGVAGYHRPVHGSTLNKKRLGYEARYEFQNLSLKWEYLFGQGTRSGAVSSAENATKATGWYAQAGYTLAPWWPKLQGVVRFESFDPNELASLDQERDLTLGLNYFIERHNAKAQLNWVHKDEQGDDVGNDQVIAAFQYAF